jgi:hypothetical protein
MDIAILNNAKLRCSVPVAICLILMSMSCKYSADKETGGNVTSDSHILLENEKQTFEINTGRDTVIICKRGTKIFLPANCFELKRMTPQEETILVEVIEAYTPGSIIANHLSTMTNDGNLLETAGMLNLSATSEVKKISIKKDFKVEVSFVDISPEDNLQYQVYKGNQSNNITIWDSIPLGCEYEIKFDTAYNEDKSFQLIPIDEGWHLAKEISNRLIEIDELQLINLDRLYLDNKNKCILSFKTNKENKVYTYVFFEDKKIVMADGGRILGRSDDFTYFGNIPVGQKVKVLTYFVEKGEFYMSSLNVTVSNDIEIFPEYKLVDKVSFEDYLSKLEWP